MKGSIREMRRLAIITTHPIQYYAPIFRLLHERGKISIMVFYTWGEGSSMKYDPGFGASVNWDIPLLDGYPFTWAENSSLDPGSHHYGGIINPGLINQIEQWTPDAILCFGWAYQSHLKCLRHFKGRIPVYFRGDSTLLDRPGGLRGLVKYIFLKWVYRHIDFAFYVGINNRAYFKKYGLTDCQLGFAPHAIDNERFGVEFKAQADELRASLLIRQNDILILYAGKFERVKNIELLLSAFIKLNRPDIRLLLVGNGDLSDKLREAATGSHSRTNIHFMDFQNQSLMPVIYQSCDLFCLPSLSETWGLCINEAMASGKAVLVSDKVGCAVDLVKDDYNGGIFKSGDEQGLAALLDKLTKSRENLIRLGKNSRLMVEEWNFTQIAMTIEDKVLA